MIEMNESTLFKKVFGCIIGGAIGDALGASVENCHYKQIQETYGILQEFVPPFKGERRGVRIFPPGKNPPWRSHLPFHPLPFGIDGFQVGNGRYTDDMQGRLLNYLAIIKYGRRITIQERDKFVRQYALENLNHTDKIRREWARYTLTTLVTPTGKRPVFGVNWGSPGGVINAGNPKAGAEDGGPLGAAVAEAFKLEATADSVIKAALDYAYSYDYEYGRSMLGINRISEMFYRRALWVLDLAEKVNDVFEIRKYIYGDDPVNTFLVAYPPWHFVYPLEMFPTALAMIKIAKGDPWTAILGGANFGRDCDSIACMAGEIAGALKGIDALPNHMVKAVQEVNPDPDMKEIAEKLTYIILQNQENSER